MRYAGEYLTYEELGGFGTGALCILEDREDLIRAYAYTAGEYMLANADWGSVNTLYREFPATVGQLVQWFGIDAVSPEVRGQWERGNPDQWILIAHAIEPNDDRASSPFTKDAPFRSVYWEVNGPRERSLSRSGFSEFPVMAARWQVTGTDVYGRSPGMEALPDVKMLQVQQKRKAQAIDKLVNPPMTAPTSLRNEPASVLPGSITYVDAINTQQAGFRPAYEVNPRVGELAADINDTQTRIERAFYADLFLMLASSDRRQITAREVEERHEEKLLALGPVLERLHDELLSPLIDRTFAIMVRASVDRWAVGEAAPVPPPPHELADVDLKVELISTLAQAQRAVGLAGIERLLSLTAAVAGAKPEVGDKIDGDQIIDEAADMLGTPASVVLPDDKVAEIRTQRAQREAAITAAAAAQQGAEIAKTASGIDTEGKNALTDIIGAVTGSNAAV